MQHPGHIFGNLQWCTIKARKPDPASLLVSAALRVHFNTKLQQYNNARKNVPKEILSAQRVQSRMNTVS